MYQFFIFFMFAAISSAYEKYICTLNHTVEMKSDTVIFFESPNFPRYLGENEYCDLNFVKASSVEERKKRFFIATSNTICEIQSDCIELYDYCFNFSSYHNYMFYDAFQGFAYLDDWGDDCPLESVSRVKPFHFTDLTQVLVFSSTYEPADLRNHSCLWQFKAPENYGFKIVITSFNISNTTVFKVENNQDIIITASNIRIFQPHYSIDNYLKIYLSENNFPYIPTTDDGFPTFEFKAYITIVENYYTNPFNCNSADPPNSKFFLWSYMSDEGYPSNARCNFTLTIMPKTEVITSMTKFQLEQNVDKINYYYPNGSLPNVGMFIFFCKLPAQRKGGVLINKAINNLLQDYSLDGDLRKGDLVFYTDDDKEEREIFWEFVSDGSIQLRGFEISFDTRDCNCANSLVLVPCDFDGIDTYIMEGDDEFYCGNLNCNFTIKLDQSCISQFIVLSMVQYYNIDPYDVFNIISNNITIYKIDHDKKYAISYQIPSANDTILQIITTSSSKFRELKFSFTALNISLSLPPVIINKTKPYYFLQTCLHNDIVPYMQSIELSPNLKKRNAQIEIFIFDEDTIELLSFYKDNLSYPLNFRKCFMFVTDDVYKCKTTLSSLLIVTEFVDEECNNYILFQVAIGDNLIASEGCVFKTNNVFNAINHKSNGERIISAMSKLNQTCRIFCYAHGVIQKIWITPNSNGSIKIFSGVEEKLSTIIETTSLSLWRNLYLFQNIYMIDIPLNIAMMMTFHFDVNVEFDDWVLVNLTSIPYKTILTSPYYGNNAIIPYTEGPDLCHGKSSKFDIYQTTVQFTVLNYDVLEPNYFYFSINELFYIGTHQLNITSERKSYKFGPSQVKFSCFCYSNVNCNIRIFVETIYSNVPTTTTSIINTTTLLTTTKQSQPTTSHSLNVTANFLFLFVIGFLALYERCY